MKKPIVIFCDEVFSGAVDPDYAVEWSAVKEMDGLVATISFEELKAGNANKAIKRVPVQEDEIEGIYRGWMFTGEEYKALFEALLKKNVRLINTPDTYKHCHYLPESYAKIEGNTPLSIWMPWDQQVDWEKLFAKLEVFEGKAIILKDYVKSEKHHWDTACFIPAANDQEKVVDTVNEFVRLRGDELNHGLVFRAFESLEFLTFHERSAMPLTVEYRLFFAKRQLISVFNYWDEGTYPEIELPLEKMKTIAQEIESDFFTMDVALKKNGEWIIMELGDGQTAGLPQHADVTGFYQSLLGATIQR